MPEIDDDAFWNGAALDERARYTGLHYAGKGAYSVVARAFDETEKKRVAIKRIAEVFYDAHEAKKVLREIRLLRDFHHPHIISLRSLIYPTSIEDFEDIFMVTEWMDGDLRRRIKSGAEMQPQMVQLLMAQLLAALAHVHSVRGIHRDLKPANILLSRDGTLKLGDFGLARCEAADSRGGRTGTEHEQESDSSGGEAGGTAFTPLSPQPPPLKRRMTAYVVTRWYRAPEVILQEPYACSLDMWSVGCIFKELLELQPSAKPRTGALFPGRYCVPFSFDDDSHQRRRHDQLNVIFRVLGRPTAAEMNWASAETRADVEKLCSGWDGSGSRAREAKRKSLLADACGGRADAAELDLLAALLRLEPHARPPAATLLKHHPYFASLPPEQRPPLTPPVSEAEVANSFSFEREDLNVNDLRVLIANDLFTCRMRQQEGRATPTGEKGDAADGACGSKPEAAPKPESDVAAAQTRLRELDLVHTRCNASPALPCPAR